MPATAQDNVIDITGDRFVHRVRRGRATQHSLLNATREELYKNGWRNFELSAVLSQVHADEADIEEWWGTVAGMAVSAVLDLIEPPVVTGKQYSLERYCRVVDPFIELGSTQEGVHLLRSCLLASADDAHANGIFRQFFRDTFRGPLKQLLAQSVASKEIKANYDVDHCSEQLFGPLWHRIVVMRAPFTEDTAVRAVAGMLNSLER